MNSIEAGAMYDEFPENKRDMPKHEFIKEVCRLTDPRQFQRDLDSVMMTKNARRMSALNNKRKIDKALKKG